MNSLIEVEGAKKMQRADTKCLAAILGAIILIDVPSALADSSDSTGFPQPQIRQSSDGVLDTVLRAHIAANEVTDQLTGEIQWVHTPTYAERFPGPTLVLNPGDTLKINHINSLPPEPADQRGGRFPHDLHALNFHTHGLKVSPSGISDNIFRVMAPGTRSPIKIVIPDDHPERDVTGTIRMSMARRPISSSLVWLVF